VRVLFGGGYLASAGSFKLPETKKGSVRRERVVYSLLDDCFGSCFENPQIVRGVHARQVNMCLARLALERCAVFEIPESQCSNVRELLVRVCHVPR
jgi:hypothetical protein